MTFEILGNTDYKHMQERRYINGSAESIGKLAKLLEQEGVNFSGRISNSKGTITVSGNEAHEMACKLFNAIRDSEPEPEKKNIIETKPYKYISDKKYVNGDEESVRSVIEILQKRNIEFSSNIRSADRATITVSGESNRKLTQSFLDYVMNKNAILMLKKYGFVITDVVNLTVKSSNGETMPFDNYEQLNGAFNDINNEFFHPTAFQIVETSDTFDNFYTLYRIDKLTGEEKGVVYNSDGRCVGYESISEMMNYINKYGFKILNSNEQIEMWSEIDRNKLIERNQNAYVPMLDVDNHIEFLPDNKIVWTYFNEDGKDGIGQLVEMTITEAIVADALKIYSETDSSEEFFYHIYSNADTILIDADSYEFEAYAQAFIDDKANDDITILSEKQLNSKEIIDKFSKNFFYAETATSEKSFAEQVDASLNGSLPFYTHLKLGNTPKILLNVGLQQLPMLYTQKHLKKAVTNRDDYKHTHGLSVEQIKNIPEKLNKPIMIYDSISRNDSVVAVVNDFDKANNPIIVSIKPDGTGRYEVEEIESNFVTSIYPKDNFAETLKRLISEDKLLFCSKKQTQELFERWGLQLSELTNAPVFDTIIHQSRNIVKGSEEKSFAEQVDEVLNGTANQYNNLKICDTPQIFLDVGCEQLPMLYTQQHLRDALHPKSKDNSHWHGLTVDQIKSVPELLKSPAILFDSISNTQKGSQSIIAVLNATDNDNAPLIVSIKPNGNGIYELENIDSNFITSIYGKDNNFENFIIRAVKSGNLLYWDKNKSQELFSCQGLQLPKAINNLDSNIILHQSRNIVKGSNTEISEENKNGEQNTVKISEELSQKISTEYNFFISNLKKEKPEVIIATAYEINTKDIIRTYVENEELDLTDEQIKALLSSENVLDELYHEWNKNESANSYDDVLIVLRDRADRILTALERREKQINITQADIDILRTLTPRKSILNFSDDEKKATQKWAARFEADIAEKSPFYRADNEWRENEATSVSFVEIDPRHADFKKVRNDIKEMIIERGEFTNNDTGWNIRISRTGLEDTVKYGFKHKNAVVYDMLYSIDSIVKDSIYLDTVVSEKNNGNKANDTAFMHKLYTVCKYDNDVYLAKMTVEEFKAGNDGTLKRMYNLQDIKIEPLRHIEFTENPLSRSVLKGSEISIADLFQIVKACDKDFYLNKREEDGINYSMPNLYTTDSEKKQTIKAEQSKEETEKKKSGSEIEVGDRFLYNDSEYTVIDENGIYPDEVGVSYEKQTGGITYQTTQNIDKYKLAENGIFLGNSNKVQEKKAPSAETKKSEYVSKIGDLIDINNVLLSISDINGSIITFTETESLLGNTTRMSISDFLASDYTVVEDAKSEATPDVSMQHFEMEAEVETVNVPLEHNASNVKNYVITDDNFGVMTPKARFTANVEAIRTLNTIEAENRTATPVEQAVLSGYSGWGAIPQAFDSHNSDWENEYRMLKEILSEEEYSAARGSTLNAHYTSPVVINAIYEGLAKIGFEKGKILEPAMGIGNFFGVMPENMRGSELHGVELDRLTGRIAKRLYPDADILIKGFEKTAFENNSFDVVVGNVPFGNYKVNDKDYNKNNFLIHDYFIAKSLDKVRPGGVVAVVTSKGTMDKENDDIRKYIARRAELLGAIRLPDTAFKANAGTEVVSDILFLQKREKPIEIDPNKEKWIKLGVSSDGFEVNNYFAEHPEMVIGNFKEVSGRFGNEVTVKLDDPSMLKSLLSEAVHNIRGEYKAASVMKTVEEINADIIPAPAESRKFSYVVVNEQVYFRAAGDNMKKQSAEGSKTRIMDMVKIRDTVRELLDLQVKNFEGSNETAIAQTQKQLNMLYDNFVVKYGRISSIENRKVFEKDNSYHLIKSLEKNDDKGNFVEKSDIFTKITINPQIIVEHCNNAQDALILSLSEKMSVDMEYMSALTDLPVNELITELGDKIYQNPEKNMRWESADEYLTGNIRTKLAAAEKAGLDRNVEALRAVMPQRIEAADISVKLGSAWIAPEYIRQFILETLNPDFWARQSLNVIYSEATDKWKIEGYQHSYNNTLATKTYGTEDMNAYELIEASLNMKKVEIKERVKDENGFDIRDEKGHYVLTVNQQKTMIAQAKQEELKKKFQDWIFADPDRREKLTNIYNERFNSIRLREYDGSHLNFVGMNSDITLKEHQKNAVARSLYSNGNTLLAHEVGAGKTFEMVAIAMEGKRLGLHSKSLVTAPNALTEQWGEAFRTLYPNANVLVATEKDFKPENRKDLFAKIATGDWDAVVIGHSQFDMIHLSRDRELEMENIEVAKLEAALDSMLDESNGKRSFSVKQVEAAIKKHTTRIEQLLDKNPKDDLLTFEELGIDKIFVDESQVYKNLDTPTKMQNVSGLGSGGSGRATQLLMKCRYLDEITGGKGVVFASGTPISNSMSEMYTLMRYLQADKLKELGINSFDQWASIFGETTTSMELSPEANGKYQMKTRFAKFQNLPELMNMFKECADIKTAATLNLNRPDFEMHNINVNATEIQAEMIKELGERAKLIRAGLVKPTEDNMCKLTVDGRKIGLDQRCIDPSLPDDPNSKVNVCINNVYDIYQKSSDNKGTQLIFCDLATPQPHVNENTYTLYRKNAEGNYAPVYSDKLNDKDTAEKILKKLTGNKPPKSFNGGGVYNDDILMLQKVDYDSMTVNNSAAVASDGKLNAISDETWAKLQHEPTEVFETQRKFCIYDDIKKKLIAKGIPENEIAFIHDADTTEEKQQMFAKMNSGEIRVMIGSTQKCGAGMNAQERMIALHDLDAPMRPSDMEQRHGRIIRQGNTNSKVDIYRYTTDKTFDAYLYQMLENKQKFISQIMTDKSPVRSCEDVDEIALDYAEVKALCAGNPLIKEKIDLETEITRLNVLKSSFLSQKYALQDKAYTILPREKKFKEEYISKLKNDAKFAENEKPLVNDDGKKYYPIKIGNETYHNRELGGDAIRKSILENNDILLGKETVLGTYRGFTLSAFLDTLSKKIKVNLKNETNHYAELNMDLNVKAGGNLIRLDNAINNIVNVLNKEQEQLQAICSDIADSIRAAEAVFPKEQELSEKEKRLNEVNALLASNEDKSTPENNLEKAQDWARKTIDACDEHAQQRETDNDRKIEICI